MKTIFVSILLIIIISGEIKSQPSAVTAFSTSIIVSNIDSAVIWYTKNLGLKIRNINENKERGSKIVNLENQNVLIELININAIVDKNEVIQNYPAGSRYNGFMKVGFTVENFDDWHQFLENQSVKFRGTVVMDGHSGKRTFLVEDPEGNIVQFFEK